MILTALIALIAAASVAVLRMHEVAAVSSIISIVLMITTGSIGYLYVMSVILTLLLVAVQPQSWTAVFLLVGVPTSIVSVKLAALLSSSMMTTTGIAVCLLFWLYGALQVRLDNEYESFSLATGQASIYIMTFVVLVVGAGLM